MPKGWNAPTETRVENQNADLLTKIAIYEQKKWTMDRPLDSIRFGILNYNNTNNKLRPP